MPSVTPPTSGAKEPISKTVSFGDRVLDTKVLPYMRSRNVEFVAKRMRPLTQVFAFFNGVDVNKFIIPKLIEIRMTSGVFQVSETVVGSFDSPNLPTIRFRVATQNHKYGNYDFPEDVFDTNPYNPNLTIPATYSSTSTILNVDTFSLSDRTSNFLGYIANGMKLRGSTSRAEAVVTDIKLITNDDGVVIGSFFIPDPNVDVNPVFETGTRPFRLTSSRNNSLVVGTYTTAAEENYSADGKVNMVQENVIVTRPVRVETNITQVINVIGGPGNPVDVPFDPGYVDTGVGDGGGDFNYSVPNAPTPEPIPSPIPGNPPIPAPPPKTTLYYNFGSRELYPAGAQRLKELAKDANLPKDVIKKIDADITPKQEKRIINQINKSPTFVATNQQVASNNVKGGVATKVFGDSVVKTQDSGGRVGPGQGAPMGSPGPAPMGSPGPAPMGSPGPAPMGSPAPAPATMGQPAFSPSKPSPAPAARSSPPPSPPPAARPSPPPAPSRAPSPPPSGGGMGGMSDIRLKKNIVSINSALSKLMNLVF